MISAETWCISLVKIDRHGNHLNYLSIHFLYHCVNATIWFNCFFFSFYPNDLLLFLGKKVRTTVLVMYVIHCVVFLIELNCWKWYFLFIFVRIYSLSHFLKLLQKLASESIGIHHTLEHRYILVWYKSLPLMHYLFKNKIKHLNSFKPVIIFYCS